jgi:nucleoside-diphosphate-sugar epimerase
MFKILITGISGFVGKNIINFFSKEFIIYGLDISFDYLSGVEKVFSWKSLREIPEVDVIIHLAGKAHDLKNATNEKDYFTINTDLTKIIYDYFLASNAKMFFFMSSVKAVADQIDGLLTEDSDSNPITVYGKSKKYAEDYILSKVIENDKFFYILRPCMIHGPDNKGNLNLLYNIISKGIPYPLGAFENSRSFLSIENLSFVFKKIIENAIPSGIYQIADDEPVSTNKLIEIIAASLGSTPHILKMNPKIIRMIAKIGDYLYLPLNTERLQKLTESYVVSNEKIKRYLEISKMPVSAEEGLRQTLNSFKIKSTN